jgi:uncharacterized protein (TIGR02646 family)
MIRIARGTAPEILTTLGIAACQALCARVDEEGEGCRLKFDSPIYGHISVYQELHRMQHGKCCYCERSIDRGTIDHYRPKGAIYQAPGVRVSGHGYYWLAYTWENLLLACSDCNTRFKRQLFPLEDPSRRVLHHKAAESVTAEAPLLLDPTSDKPEEHISFRAFTPVARTRRGRESISLLQLDRSFLEGEREVIYSQIGSLCVALEAARHGMAVPHELLHGVCEQLVRFSSVAHAHAGMIQSALRQRLGPEIGLPVTHEQLMSWAVGPRES